MALTEVQEYKGNPILHIKRTPEDKYPLMIGVSKCKLILEAVEEIAAFVDQHDKPKPEAAPEAGE